MIVNLLIAIVVILLVLYVVDLLPGDAQIKNIIKAVVVVLLILWLMGGAFGWHSLRF